MKRKVVVSLSILSVLAAFVIVSPPVQVSAQSIPPELKVGDFYLGCQAYSFNRYSFFEAVDKNKEVGCSVIEAYPGQRLSPDDKTPFNHEAPLSVWAKAKIKCEQAGVRIVNYGVVGLGNDEAANRKVFDFAKVMGIPCITSEPADGSFDLVENLVKEYNIKVAIHNHPKPSKYWNPEYVAECIKGRDERIGACADIGHWARSGVKPLEALKILEGRIVSAHMKDLNEFGNRNAHDVVWGTGACDSKKVLAELLRQGFNGNMSIEYEHNWTTSVPEIKECVNFVRELKTK